MDEYNSNNYIIIPKSKNMQEATNDPIICRQEEKNICCNCGEKYKYTLRFGKGVNEIKIKLCEECMKQYKIKLDKEFGNTFWGTVGKYIKSRKENIRVIPISNHSQALR